MRDYEDRVWPQFAVRSAVTPQDRDEIQRRSKTGQTILIGNGTNPELWLANARSDTDRIIFFGNLNILRISTEFWILAPHLAARCPAPTFSRAGRRWHPRDSSVAQPGSTSRICVG